MMAIFRSIPLDESFQFLCWFFSPSIPTQRILVPVHSIRHLIAASAQASSLSIRLTSVVWGPPLSGPSVSFTALRSFIIPTAKMFERNGCKWTYFWTGSECTRKNRLNTVSVSGSLLHVKVVAKYFILDNLFPFFSHALGTKTSRWSGLRLLTCPKSFMTRDTIREISIQNWINLHVN